MVPMTPGMKLFVKVVQVAFVILAEPAGDVQAAGRRAGHLLEDAKRFNQVMKPFLRTYAGKIANDVGRFFARWRGGAVASKIQPRIDDMQPIARDAEVASHKLGV